MSGTLRFLVPLLLLAVAARAAIASHSDAVAEAVEFHWPAEASVVSGTAGDRRENDPAPIASLFSTEENLFPGLSFDAVDASGCCGPAVVVPSRPNLAVGPAHLVVATTYDFEVFDLAGVRLAGASLSTFFDPLGPNCKDAFFPDALYDEATGRFFVGATSGNGQSYCAAVTATASPTSSWYLYEFPLGGSGTFYTPVHAGVGHDAIYLGAVEAFGAESKVIALQKSAMYSGGPSLLVVRLLASSDVSPHPIHLRGWVRGAPPAAGPHYFISTPDLAQPAQMELRSWSDPFGANTLSAGADLDLAAIHQNVLGVPQTNPQAGGTDIEASSARITDFEFESGGFGWVINGVSCNRRGVVVNCLQRAKIDLAAGSLVEAWVFGRKDVYRSHGDLAVDRCGNLAVGYSRFTNTTYPSSYVAGALSPDPFLRAELPAKIGEVPYQSFSYRWGESTGMTVDPSGQKFWYAGAYTKNQAEATNWATTVASFSFPSCDDSFVFVDQFESGDTTAWSASFP